MQNKYGVFRSAIESQHGTNPPATKSLHCQCVMGLSYGHKRLRFQVDSPEFYQGEGLDFIACLTLKHMCQ